MVLRLDGEPVWWRGPAPHLVVARPAPEVRVPDHDTPRTTTPAPDAPGTGTGGLTVRELDASTWDAFAELVERNNGIFGGCWCIGWHPECGQRGISHRDVKERRVRTGGAHAALVVDAAGLAQGWAQYGSPQELPNIKHRRRYDQEPPPTPDWRIACVYVDRRHRGQGVARVALEGALDAIARQGGGRVEAISETTADREAQGRFLFSGTVELFERHDFERVRQVGKHAWIVQRVLVAR